MEQPLKSYLLIAVAGIVPPALLWLFNRNKHTTPSTTAAMPPTPEMQRRRNLKAFLLTIQYAEGTYGPNAYRMLYGGGLFNGFAHHPNQRITRWGITSTAAGAYQFLFSTWDEVKAKLGLTDFSPLSQDRAAIELIRQKKALEDVYAGRFATAIQKCRKTWASFPNAGHGQNERSLAQLEHVYRVTGGAQA